MRLDRDGTSGVISAFYSLDGTNWVALGNVTQMFNNPRLGIIVGSSPSGYPNADLAWAEVIAYAKPLLKLDPPWPSPGNKLELTVRTANGTPIDSNRLAATEVRASTNLALSASAWSKLTNNLLLTNGVGRVLNVDGGPSRRYFIVREPQ